MANSTACSFSDNIYFPCNVDDGPMKHSSSHSIILASNIVIAALSPVAVVGNSLVLAAIWKKTFERTSFHILLSALALTDLIIGLVSQPFVAVPYFLFLVNPSVFVGRRALLTKLVAVAFSIDAYFSGSTICILTFMSVERWLHMTRRSLTTPRRRCFAITVLLLSQVPIAVLAAVDIVKGRDGREVQVTVAIFMLLCYFVTSFSYFKVFQVIRQHQQQVQGKDSCQNVAQQSINLGKYKRTMVTIFYILALFSISTLPIVVSLAVLVYEGITFETSAAYYVCLVLFYSSSSLNPILYLWRMNDIRNGVKRLFSTSG